MPHMMKQDWYRKHQGFIRVASKKNQITVTVEEKGHLKKKKKKDGVVDMSVRDLFVAKMHYVSQNLFSSVLVKSHFV